MDDVAGAFFGSIFGAKGLCAEAGKSNPDLNKLLENTHSQFSKDCKNNVNIISVDYPDETLIKNIYALNF